MEEEYDISSKFVKSKKPSVPEGFFENFYNSMKDEIDAEDAFTNLKIVKRQKPFVPENFKTDFTTDINKKINPKSSNRGRIIRMSFISAVASAAAVLTILFYMNKNDASSEASLQITNSEANIKQDEDVIDDYVASLDEDEMIEYIIENDISVGDEDDDIYDYVESEIEDTYLDL